MFRSRYGVSTGTSADPHADEPRQGYGDSPSFVRPTHIVGIGASAGGLEALQSLFEYIPAKTGLAFVIVQHLSPDFRSMMDELLSKHTSMPIHRVEDGMLIEADTVYLIPPKKELFVSDGRLLLSDKDTGQGMSLPIDLFFRSLAQDAGKRAVGIVLSGTGSDGSRGIRNISKAGGLVMAQSEESASFSGMPRSAVSSGVVDLVLPPEAMGPALLRFLQTPMERPPKNEEGPDFQDNSFPLPPGDSALAPASDQNRYGKVFSRLMEHYGIDFVFYKPSTISRRIERRLAMTGIADLEDYAEALRHDRAELDRLYKDLLIGVTQFFRDQKAFESLQEEVVPSLVRKSAAGAELRIWCPACATGEEVYSLAILLKEHAERVNAPLNMKLFATDVHRDSLDKAAAGLYSRESLEKLPEKFIEKYFVPQGQRFRISPELRHQVVFAEHNVIKDPPFTKVDLISCRNLLIYLQPIVQNKVLSYFHFALHVGGVLFLGPSESLGDLYGEFSPVDKRWNIFRKKRDIRLPLHSRFPSNAGLSPRPMQGVTGKASVMGEGLRLTRTYESLLQRFVPPGMLVNERNELAYMFGDAGAHLHYQPGRFGLDILNMVHGDLRVALATAFQRVRKDGVPVVFKKIRAMLKGKQELVNVSVEPVPHKTDEHQYLLVAIESAKADIGTGDGGGLAEAGNQEQFAAGAEAHHRIQDLEQEVVNMRESLQSTVEELETSNEELQASNEELLASNEELQSTNEELHSVNEELYTVNAEYEKKIKELTQLGNDVNNLLRVTELATLFVDMNLNIRMFTPSLTRYFNLLPQDKGRPLGNITHKLVTRDLLPALQSVLDTGKPAKSMVQSIDGLHLMQRITPYLDENDDMQGAALTYLDVSDLVTAREELRIAVAARDVQPREGGTL